MFLSLEKTKKKKICILWVFLYFYIRFLGNYQGYKDVLVFFRLVFWFFNKKVNEACWEWVNKWVVSASFKRCVWRYPVVKPSILSSFLMRQHALFHMVWHVTMSDGRIFVYNRFYFFPSFSLSWQVKSMIVLFFFFNFSPHSFNFFISFIFLL